MIVSTWCWGDKYPPRYRERLAASVARRLALPHAFRVFAPEPQDSVLCDIPGCFARLRAFDLQWQARQGIEPGERIVCLDLDLIVTGALDTLLARPEPFAILQGVNAANPCPYNGSVWWTTAGYRPDVWTDFSLEAAQAVPHFDFPDDQAWLAHKLPRAAAIGAADGVYAFAKVGWPAGTNLPADARLVAFPGWRDPATFEHLDWVREHWRV